MIKPVYTNRFQKDYKLCQKRSLVMSKLDAVLYDLENEIPLSPLLKEHPLQGTYKGCLECHIEPDWLLIYKFYQDAKELHFIRTGTHADLFE